jgi:2-dehydro-3-deoxygalactonokinase
MITYRGAERPATKRPATFMSSATDQAPPGGTAPALIGVDWGTSSCRACLMTAAGAILDMIDTRNGILQIRDKGFAQALETMIGAWRRPGLPVVLSGMIGSRQGWIEVPYLPVPASFDALAHALARHPEDADIRIAPGLAQDLPGQAPDVMRGEETQIIGALGDASGRQLLVLPGTHSKWVLIEDQEVLRFATFMTGELFAVLKDHSILGRLMAEGGGAQADAFALGLDAAESLPGGLLQHLFSARTLALFDRLPADAIATYLSGLLIGHELQDGFATFGRSADLPPVTVIGASALSARYLQALERAGIAARRAGEHMAARGQWALARAANLLMS